MKGVLVKKIGYKKYRSTSAPLVDNRQNLRYRVKNYGDKDIEVLLERVVACVFSYCEIE